MTSFAKYRKVSFLFDLAGKKKKDNLTLTYTKEIPNSQFFCPKLFLKKTLRQTLSTWSQGWYVWKTT